MISSFRKGGRKSKSRVLHWMSFRTALRFRKVSMAFRGAQKNNRVM